MTLDEERYTGLLTPDRPAGNAEEADGREHQSFMRTVVVDAAEVMNTVWKHRVLSGLVLLFTTAAAVLYALISTPVYTSTGLVQTSDAQTSLISPVADFLPGAERGAAETQLQLIRSRDMMLDILKRHGLHITSPEDGGSFTIDSEVIRGNASPISPKLQRLRAAVDYVNVAPTTIAFQSMYLRRGDSNLEVAISPVDPERPLDFIPVPIGEELSITGNVLKFNDLPIDDGEELEVLLATDDWLYRTYNTQFGSGLVEVDGARTSLVRVSFTSVDRDLSQSVVNTAMDVYIAKSLELQVTNADLSLTFITGRLKEVEQNLLAAERELSDFAKGEGAIALEEQARSTVENASELQLDKLRTALQLNAIEALLVRLRNRKPGTTAGLTGNYMVDPILERSVSEFTSLENDISRLRATLRDDHPEVQRNIKELEERKLELNKQLRSARKVLRSHMTELESQVLRTTDTLREFPDKMLTLQRLERDVEVYMSLYRQLLEKGQEADILRASTTVDKRVIDRANFPVMKRSPQRTKIVIFAALLGILLAAASAIAYSNVSDELTSIQEIRSLLTFPEIGRIAQLETEKQRISPADVWLKPNGPVAEAFRNLFVAISLLPSRTGQGLVIQVSSSRPKEGKSSIISNLAAITAKSGKKVLLVDLDLRKPVQHRIWGLPRSPGYSDIVGGLSDISVEECTQQSEESENLHVISAGTRLTDSLSSLEASLLSVLVEKWRTQYDIVLLDSPPLFVPDTLLVSNVSDHLVVVVRPGTVRRSELTVAMNRLKDVEIPKSVVFNGVLASHEGYGYASTYYYNRQYTDAPDDDNVGGSGSGS